MLAEESEMELKEYLEKGLVLVIKTHAEKLGMNKKSYVTEFTNEHTSKPKTRVSSAKKQF
jgi:hypothetical protein